jgi:hypothetical protein
MVIGPGLLWLCSYVCIASYIEIFHGRHDDVGWVEQQLYGNSLRNHCDPTSTPDE